MVVNGVVFLFSLSNSSLSVYRDAINFCILILYPETSLNSFIRSNSLLVETLGFSIYSVMSLENSDSFTFPLLIWMPILNISFSCLTAVARAYNTLLNSIVFKNGHPCPGRKSAQLFTIGCNISWGLS